MDMSLREGAGRVALSDLCEERIETKPSKQSPTHKEIASGKACPEPVEGNARNDGRISCLTKPFWPKHADVWA
jgi:hypothetical protein